MTLYCTINIYLYVWQSNDIEQVNDWFDFVENRKTPFSLRDFLFVFFELIIYFFLSFVFLFMYLIVFQWFDVPSRWSFLEYV